MISYVTALTSVQIKQHQCVTSIKTEEQTSICLVNDPFNIQRLNVRCDYVKKGLSHDSQ
jgi:hypothetical protein